MDGPTPPSAFLSSVRRDGAAEPDIVPRNDSAAQRTKDGRSAPAAISATTNHNALSPSENKAAVSPNDVVQVLFSLDDDDRKKCASWLSLLKHRPPDSDEKAMRQWLLEVMSVSEPEDFLAQSDSVRPQGPSDNIEASKAKLSKILTPSMPFELTSSVILAAASIAEQEIDDGGKESATQSLKLVSQDYGNHERMQTREQSHVYHRMTNPLGEDRLNKMQKQNISDSVNSVSQSSKSSSPPPGSSTSSSDGGPSSNSNDSLTSDVLASEISTNKVEL